MIPQEALLTSEQIEVAWDIGYKESKRKADRSKAMDGMVGIADAASEHTWAYLEPVLRGLMEAGTKAQRSLIGLDASLAADALRDALAAARQALKS